MLTDLKTFEIFAGLFFFLAEIYNFAAPLYPGEGVLSFVTRSKFPSVQRSKTGALMRL